jgi:putative DNA methylase
MLPKMSYRKRVDQARRPEEVMVEVHDHIWESVNAHLGTSAQSFPELVEQLGIMRFGRRPRVADTFCGSGQIPFEAARLGCEVFASDLNPVACMLTWGAFHIVGASPEHRIELDRQQESLLAKVQADIDELAVETDGSAWRTKTFLYCLEARCPQSGWIVPLLPSLIISRSKRTIAKLVPDSEQKRYDIVICSVSTDEQLAAAAQGTVVREGRFSDPYLIHMVDGVAYKTRFSTLRGDFEQADGVIGNRLRQWEKEDFKPRPDDILQERLYAIHWMRPKEGGKSFDYEFRSVTVDDLERERIVEAFISQHLADWQRRGWLPDMRIEPGGPPRYEALNLIRGRGWTHWHHLFNPRQLLVNGLISKYADTAALKICVSQAVNWNSKLSSWDGSPGVDTTHQTFYNQSVNTVLFTYGTRSSVAIAKPVAPDYKRFPIDESRVRVGCIPADTVADQFDVFITDPPYGDAVKYEEILEFFIAWLRKNPPSEFAHWVWDSRRSFAIKGEDEGFRRSMVAAYRRMTECMPENGIQVVMFTHQSGSIWADMANIVWASGLQVTAAWYVVTETDSFVREGSFVKGTVLLILRKRQGNNKTTQDDLAWEIQEEVEDQVRSLTGLNQSAKGL